jgi:hypothetical protein
MIKNTEKMKCKNEKQIEYLDEQNCSHSNESVKEQRREAERLLKLMLAGHKPG